MKIFKSKTRDQQLQSISDLFVKNLNEYRLNLEEKAIILNQVKSELLKQFSEVQSDCDKAINKLI